MAKKIVLLLALILTVGCMKAQLAVGDWRVFPVYSGSVNKMIDTQDKMYIFVGTSLFSYDKNDDLGEVYAYTSRNMLSENQISNIYYNNDNGYLLVVYYNSNIDLIYDNGDVVNMSEIKDAILQSKTINDVAFDAKNNRIYIATSFGLVVYDDKKHYVVESGNYNTSITGIGVVGDKLVISYDSTMAYSDVSSRHNSLSVFNTVGSMAATTIQAVSDSKALVLSGTSVKLVTFDFTNNAISSSNVISSGASNIGVSKNGYYTYSSTVLADIDSSLNITNITLPTELKSNAIAYWNGISNMWAAHNDNFTIEGIGNYNLSSDGSVTVLQDRFIPEKMCVTVPSNLYFGPSGKLYVNNSMSLVFKVNEYVFTHINTYENGEWKDVLPTNIPEQKAGSYYETAGISNVAEDPEDPNTYYYGNFWKGIRKVEDCQSIINYDSSNSTLYNSWGCIATDLAFDKYNNLWAMTHVTDAVNSPALHMLPAEKRKLDTTTKEDWQSRPLPNAKIGKGGRMLVCKKSNMVFVLNVDYGGILTAIYTNGTPTDFSDDKVVTYTSFVDQDGKSFAPTYLMDIKEDQNGKVWIATSDGVIELSRPEDYKNENVAISRIKVPRNDGTSFADYLLDGQTVTSISVDPSNRKWLGTQSTGVYLVNETGSEVLENFNTENSYLPSDCVYDVACDPNSASVFIGTSMGLAEYIGNSSPAEDDYSNVYAYPNPVRPDYTGWITVTGLMDNSLVKIADAAGNVLYTTTSEGGMITWDGCNSAGERVKTGVYYVFASQNATGDASGVVTKILVVK